MKTISFSASQLPYLHKDFHGALCYAIHYLDQTFGPAAAEEYLRQVALHCYAPLLDNLKTRGLSALEEHFRDIFTREEGRFDLRYENGVLIMEVSRCPAVCHLLSINQLFTDRFCQTTVIVNQTLCRAAGFDCSCDYQPGKGKCIQKFWKSKDQTA